MVVTDQEYLVRAYEFARKSPDLSTQNGALLVSRNGVVCTAYNRLPYGVQERAARLERPLKYEFTEHAERGAIYEAARSGISTLGAVLYCPWAACADCARAIIQAGVVRLVRHTDATEHGAGSQKWDGSISTADEMLIEAGVRIVEVSGKLTGFNIRHAGSTWSP